jgi:hypothetical protein
VTRIIELHRLGPAELITIAKGTAKRKGIVVDHLSAGNPLAKTESGKHLRHLFDDVIVIGFDREVVRP